MLTGEWDNKGAQLVLYACRGRSKENMLATTAVSDHQFSFLLNLIDTACTVCPGVRCSPLLESFY